MITIPGKIPIRIYPIFWIFVVLISALNADTTFKFVSWVLVIFVSVIVHEMGHALTAIAFGQKAHIDLLGFGGLTHRYGKKVNAWRDFLIVFNGPLAGVLLCIASYILLSVPVNYSANALYTLQLFFYANIFWTVINLIPVQPLDGGHLLRIPLEGFFGLKGVRVAFFISLVLAIGFSVLFFAYNFLLGGVLFMMLTYENYKAWKASLELTAADQSQPLQQLLRDAQDASQAGNEEEAFRKAEEIRKASTGGVLYVNASLLQAEIFAKHNRWQDAFSILNPLRNKLSPIGLKLLQYAAYQMHLWDEAIAIGTLAYQASPHYEIALRNAISHAQRNEAQPAIGWLKCAMREGLPHQETILRMPEFDPIRRDPLFQNLESQQSH
jgi:Zn-dependent protease